MSEALEFEWPILAELRGLQSKINLEPNSLLRRKLVSLAIAYKDIEPPISSILCSATTVYARKPHKIGVPESLSSKLVTFDRGFLFRGRPLGVACLEIGDTNTSTISVNFPQPEVIDIDPIDAPYFRELEFVVPVNCIEPISL